MPPDESRTDTGSAATSFRLFVNYRRDDTRPYARLVHDALAERWTAHDQVFWDIDRIEIGLDFVEAINRAVGRCDVLITLIGPGWLAATDASGTRRVDNPEDYVRLEIEAALRRDVRVIPVLVSGAVMPRAEELPTSLAPLTRRNALELTDTHWDFDLQRLIEALERMESSKAAQMEVEEAAARRFRARPAAPPVAREPREQQAAPSEAAPEGHPSGAVPAGRAPRTVWTRRRLLLLAAVAGAAVLAAVGVSLYLTSRSGGSAPSGVSMHTGGGGAYPDAIEDQLLLAHVPEAIRPSCRRAAQKPGDEVFLRSVSCSAGPAGQPVTYRRAHSGEALAAFFLRQVAAAHVPFPSRTTCSTTVPSAGTWVRVGTTGHMEARSRTAEGRVFCSSRGGRFSILWTDTPTKVFASASAAGGDRNAVYGWWRDQAGPEKALGMEHEMRATGPYPDAIERELLLAHLPSNVRAGCKRTMTPDPNVFLRSVTCSGPSGGLARYSYAHSGTALRVYYLNRVTAEGVEYPTSDACRTSATAARPWRFFEATKGETTSRRADGTVLCFLRGTKAGLEWTDIGTLIYGSASARASARGALYDWWRMHSGPVASTEMATGHAMK